MSQTINPCQNCSRRTVHDIVKSERVYPTSEEPESTSYEIVRCRGCLTVSFRTVFSDPNAGHWAGPDPEDYEYDEEITCYPPALENHKSLSGLHHLPKTVSTIYKETMTALAHGATILGGVGLRATLEAVCNAQNVTGSDLAVRIDQLADDGIISNADAARLHSIRFIGNDAAHELKPVDAPSISIALKIVEHLLESTYILDSEADGSFEPTFSTFDDLINQLAIALPNFQSGEELPLFVLLGPAARRFRKKLKTFDTELMQKIQSSAYLLLKMGKKETHPSAKGKIQHYIVS